ncbi:MAG: hypothetical protein HY801_14910 [Candidatus Lindowbacteria bacterium]|nr:hypothetical protein [Candidatus Lindowbacteria bacterium]
MTFVVQWKTVAGAAVVAQAVSQTQEYVRQSAQKAVPVVAVPFMGKVGQEICETAGVSWMDLSGNARVIAPGVRIMVEGKPNRFIRRGRPSSVFAPKSSRIARWLLMHPDEPLTQREIARATEMDEGFTSRIIARLEKDELLIRNREGAIKPRAPDLLLNAWQEEYDFSKHRIIYGHIPARSGDILLRQVSDALADAAISYAATGLAAAWLLDHFASFRIATIYVPEEPSQDVLDNLSYHKDSRGANCWLVVPTDSGVFHGVSLHDRVRCVHPVQVFLDLKGHPERSQEAAERLRANHLNWKKNGR